jgi:hypothetical protein
MGMDFDRIVAQGERRQQLLEELKRNDERLEQRLRRVVDGLTLFEAILPAATVFDGEGPVLARAKREALADAALAFCSTVREEKFGRGLESFLQSTSKEEPSNHVLAVNFWRLASTGDRTAIVEWLAQLDRLPKRPDDFDSSAPSQQGVWRHVAQMFDHIVRWPNLRPEPHHWHPDVIEGARIHAELKNHGKPASLPHCPDLGSLGEGTHQDGRGAGVTANPAPDADARPQKPLSITSPGESPVSPTRQPLPAPKVGYEPDWSFTDFSASAQRELDEWQLRRASALRAIKAHCDPADSTPSWARTAEALVLDLDRQWSREWCRAVSLVAAPPKIQALRLWCDLQYAALGLVEHAKQRRGWVRCETPPPDELDDSGNWPGRPVVLEDAIGPLMRLLDDQQPADWTALEQEIGLLHGARCEDDEVLCQEALGRMIARAWVAMGTSGLPFRPRRSTLRRSPRLGGRSTW